MQDLLLRLKPKKKASGAIKAVLEENQIEQEEEESGLQWFWDEGHGQMLAMAVPMSGPPAKRQRTEDGEVEEKGKGKGKSKGKGKGKTSKGKGKGPCWHCVGEHLKMNCPA